MRLVAYCRVSTNKDEQLEKLGVEYFDFYLIHCLFKKNWEEKALGYGILDFLIEMKKQGKIKYLGFSFHDTYDVFEEIINRGIEIL